MENSEDLAKKVLNLARETNDTGEKLTTRAHMQKGEGSRRLGKQHRAMEATNWADVGPGRSAQAGRPSPF
jgi:hypothetical protein